jgi:hypothetical protein
MQIYIFRSESKRELCAFAGDVSGSQLPERFGPWRATGVIKPERKPPHNLPREQIESAISDEGFQLWRMKSAARTENDPHADK